MRLPQALAGGDVVRIRWAGLNLPYVLQTLSLVSVHLRYPVTGGDFELRESGVRTQ